MTERLFGLYGTKQEGFLEISGWSFNMSWTRVCAALLAFATIQSASAEEFPARPVTIISPYQAGGTSDIIARVIAEKISAMWHQPAIVENRPGANAAIGVMSVVRASPDGYTMLAIASSGLTLNPLVFPALPYDVTRDLAPITVTGEVANVLVVNPNIPADNVRELVALARAKPGALMYASQGIGSNGHVTGEMFKLRAGIDLTHVPYKGSAAAISDLVAGQTQLMFDNLPSALPQIRGGTLRAIAVTTAARSTLLPNVPTIAESGFPDFDTSAWFAVLVAKATPEAVRQQIEKAIVSALNAPDMRERLAALGIDVAAKGASELSERIAREMRMWKDVVDTVKIKIP
jgi:tripartite-type tricarboxylate transporter receptor subunit TctC